MNSQFKSLSLSLVISTLEIQPPPDSAAGPSNTVCLRESSGFLLTPNSLPLLVSVISVSGTAFLLTFETSVSFSLYTSHSTDHQNLILLPRWLCFCLVAFRLYLEFSVPVSHLFLSFYFWFYSLPHLSLPSACPVTQRKYQSIFFVCCIY